MTQERGAAAPPPGRTGLLPAFVAGALLALLGWLVVRQLRAPSLERIVDRAPAAWTIAFIFRPKECPSRMDLVDRLNRLGRAPVQVRGVLVTDPREFPDWHVLVEANQIDFPVTAVAPGVAEAALLGTPTPALVVFDPEGRLRLLTDLTEQGAADRLLDHVLSEARRPPPRGGA